MWKSQKSDVKKSLLVFFSIKKKKTEKFILLIGEKGTCYSQNILQIL